MLGIPLLASVIFILVGLNVYASVVVARSAETPHSKKWAQCLFVWLLPYIGAIITLTVHKPTSTSSSIEDVGIYDGANMPGQLNDYDEMQ